MNENLRSDYQKLIERLGNKPIRKAEERYPEWLLNCNYCKKRLEKSENKR